MENTKKIIVSILLVCFINSCAQEEYLKVADQIYEDASGNLYLKVKNKPLLHPSKDVSKIADSIYLMKVYDESLKKSTALKDIIDVNSFQKINNGGNYFKDDKYAYVYINAPKPIQFYCISSEKATFLGNEKDYMKKNDSLYHKGIIINNLDTSKLTFLYLKSTKPQHSIEMLADSTNLFYDGSLLDLERLNYLDLNKKTKDSLIRSFFNKN